MTTQIRQFESLDSMFRIRLASQKGKRRRVCRNGERRDAIGRLLDQCNSPSEIGELALKFGMHPDEVFRIAKSSANFGLFRMAIGNCLRGILNRGVLRCIGNYLLDPRASLELPAADVLVSKIIGYPPVKQTL